MTTALLFSQLEGGLDGLPLRVSNEGLPRPRVARAHSNNVPSRLARTLLQWSRTRVDPMRPSSEARLIYNSPHREQAKCPSLRASNEHCFTVRVLRARRTVACSLPIPSPSSSS